MEGWVDLGYPAMHRPEVEPAISRSQVQRPNHYTNWASSSTSSSSSGSSTDTEFIAHLRPYSRIAFVAVVVMFKLVYKWTVLHEKHLDFCVSAIL